MAKVIDGVDSQINGYSYQINNGNVDKDDNTNNKNNNNKIYLLQTMLKVTQQ